MLRLAPFAYFQYELSQVCVQNKKRVLCDATGGNKFYMQQLQFRDSLSPVGMCWISGETAERQSVSFEKAVPAIPASVNAFTIDVALRFDADSMDTYRMGFAEAQIVISPGSVVFALVDSTLKADKKNRVTIAGNRAGGLTDSIYDGQWHHFAFVFRGDAANNSGMMEVWVDGKTSSAFRKKTGTASCRTTKKFGTGFLPAGHSSEDCIDELAIWFKALPANVLMQHSADFFSGKHYSTTIAGSKAVVQHTPEMFPVTPRTRDPLAYAPGYPDYSVSQLDQLEAFPLPRFPVVRFHLPRL
jgi:hypothetical protein